VRYDISYCKIRTGIKVQDNVLEGSIVERVEDWLVFVLGKCSLSFLRGLSFVEDDKWSKDFLIGSVEGTCHF
jgi:hypothetical protein